jgi:hypothetical protein
MPCYPEPACNPNCQCRGNPMRAFFCPVGHMLECHYPHDCRTAGCSHLGKYDLEPEEVAAAEELAIDRLKLGQLAGYFMRKDGQVFAVPIEES